MGCPTRTPAVGDPMVSYNSCRNKALSMLTIYQLCLYREGILRALDVPFGAADHFPGHQHRSDREP